MISDAGSEVETGWSIDRSSPYFDGYSGSTYNAFSDVTAWDYRYAPASQEYCGTYNFVTRSYSIAGDLVT
jgi:hypothetical protein